MTILDILVGYIFVGFVYEIFCSRREDSKDKYLDLILLWVGIFSWPFSLWSDIKLFSKKGESNARKTNAASQKN
jgi:hypothetical protein